LLAAAGRLDPKRDFDREQQEDLDTWLVRLAERAAGCP